MKKIAVDAMGAITHLKPSLRVSIKPLLTFQILRFNSMEMKAKSSNI